MIKSQKSKMVKNAKRRIIILCHKKCDLSVTEISIPIVVFVLATESESEVGFARSRQDFELFIVLIIEKFKNEN